MNIVIFGTGRMGAPLAELARQAGHAVRAFDSQGDPLAALDAAQIVVLATRYEQALALAARSDLGSKLAGKVVVDLTNPLTPDYMGLTLGHTSSAGEEIAARLPGARVVKAFNTVFASLLDRQVAGHPVAIPVFVAGDDPAAVAAVIEFIRSVGFEPVAAGGLSNARYLEPMAELMIQLGYGLGRGDRIGFGLLTEG